MKRSDFLSVKELQKDFMGKREMKGIHFKQVYNDQDWYIYELTQNGYTWFEVFKEKICCSFTVIDGKFITSHSVGMVKYPSMNDFGNWAWTASTFDRAKERTTLK